MLDKLGIVLDSDPRKVTQQGLYQPDTPNSGQAAGTTKKS
jgi:hypothetical protein